MIFQPLAAKLRCSTLCIPLKIPPTICGRRYTLPGKHQEASYHSLHGRTAHRKCHSSGRSSYLQGSQDSKRRFQSIPRHAVPQVERLEESLDSLSDEEIFKPLRLGKHSAQSGSSSGDEKAFSISNTQAGDATSNPILIRDACRCSQCVDISDKQRNFSYAQIPTDTEAESVEVDDEGTWKIRWKNDIAGVTNHISSYTSTDRFNIAPQYTEMEMKMSKHPQGLWDNALFQKENRHLKFHDFMNDPKSLAEGLQFLWRYGLLFLDEVPKRETSVREIAERIGPLRTTFYGPTWDVRSVPQAKNVAYTSKHLGFHMDLLYMRESPAYQLLHCLENTCTGGESRFADTYKAIDTVISENKSHLEALQTTNVRYEYSNDGFYYTDSKPTVSSRPGKRPPRSILDAQNVAELQEIDNVYWSPPFVGSATTAPGKSDAQVREFIEASKAFADVLERDEMVYETKMDAGTCAIFDNLRVVHARNAFDLNSGKRWLRGAYLDRQDFISRYAAVVHGA